MKRAIAFVVVFAFVTLVYWLGGFNFDARGFWLGHWFFVAIGLGVLAYNYPGFDK